MFPGVVIPITASRDKSIKLINDSNTNDKLIGVVSQKDSKVQSPSLSDIHPTGTVAKILRVLKMPDGNVTVIIQGKKRFSIEQIVSEEPYITAKIKEIPELKPEKIIKNLEPQLSLLKILLLK
jgi:ATP-dependent Lon protease